jgi:hypothetical protein
VRESAVLVLVLVLNVLSDIECLGAALLLVGVEVEVVVVVVVDRL